jgi:uncharacterized glyoxalase superfamily protein PhnB
MAKTRRTAAEKSPRKVAKKAASAKAAKSARKGAAGSTRKTASKTAAQRASKPAKRSASAKRPVERRGAGAQSLRLKAVAPALTVDDIERSLKHYVEGVGFTVKERWEENGKLLGLMLVAGSCELGLSQDDWAKGRDRKKGIGFSLYAETTQDLEGLAKRCRAAGIVVDGPKTEPWGARTVAVTDPDGFKLILTASG